MSKAQVQSDRIEALLFDLDGTLLDSFACHLEAFRQTFAHYGIEMSDELFRGSYSPDWYQTYRAFGLPANVWKEADSYWAKITSARSPVVFPGVGDSLAVLSRRFTLGVVTSGSRTRVRAALARTALDSFFKVVITGDDVKQKKPSPEGLLMALRELRLRPDQALFIGDAEADLKMARAAGTPFIGVSSKFENLSQRHRCVRIDSISTLPAML